MDTTRQSQVKDDSFKKDSLYIRERYWIGLVSHKLKMTLLRKTIYIRERYWIGLVSHKLKMTLLRKTIYIRDIG